MILHKLLNDRSASQEVTGSTIICANIIQTFGNNNGLACLKEVWGVSGSYFPTKGERQNSSSALAAEGDEMSYLKKFNISSSLALSSDEKQAGIMPKHLIAVSE